MSHKEQLLDGAKQCLSTKGYARTTSRDIVAASGTNLASIGYHYGSKEALLTAAMIELVGEWTDNMVGTLFEGEGAPVPLDRFEEAFNRLVRSFDEVRPMLAANFEVIAQLNRTPEIRQRFARAHESARKGLAGLVLQVPVERVTRDQEDTIGAFVLVLVTGLMAQYLVSPEETPDGTQLAAAVRALAASPGDATQGPTGEP